MFTNPNIKACEINNSTSNYVWARKIAPHPYKSTWRVGEQSAEKNRVFKPKREAKGRKKNTP
jgi:hypothetical protein